MAKNIEIKVAIADVAFCLTKAKTLSGSDAEVITQEDYFFNCENGRLKLRILNTHYGELIFYNRKNEAGPTTSEYYISKTTEPDKLLQVLEKSYGIFGEVRKTRKLFLIDRIRVHIDQVEGLGSFMGFEVVLSEGEDIRIGESEANDLMATFKIEKSNLIQCAYVDLLNEKLNSLERK